MESDPIFLFSILIRRDEPGTSSPLRFSRFPLRNIRSSPCSVSRTKLPRSRHSSPRDRLCSPRWQSSVAPALKQRIKRQCSFNRTGEISGNRFYQVFLLFQEYWIITDCISMEDSYASEFFPVDDQLALYEVSCEPFSTV